MQVNMSHSFATNAMKKASLKGQKETQGKTNNKKRTNKTQQEILAKVEQETFLYEKSSSRKPSSKSETITKAQQQEAQQEVITKA